MSYCRLSFFFLCACFSVCIFVCLTIHLSICLGFFFFSCVNYFGNESFKKKTFLPTIAQSKPWLPKHWETLLVKLKVLKCVRKIVFRI